MGTWTSAHDILQRSASFGARHWEASTPLQQAMATEVLNIAAAWERGEINIGDAIRQTEGGFIRWEVFRMVGLDHPEAAMYRRFINACAEAEADGVAILTKSGWIDRDLITEENRARITYRDNPNGGRDLVIEFMEPVGDGWRWPSARPVDQEKPKVGGFTDPKVQRQYETWYSPEDTP